MIGLDQQEKRTEELILVINQLENASLTPDELEKLGNKLKSIYLSREGELYRHSYSEITNYMYVNHVVDKIPTTDPGTVILENLRIIEEDWESEETSESKELLCNALKKLIDHISLEVVRLGQMADIYYKLTQTSQLNETMSFIIQGVTDTAQKIEKQKEEADRVGKELEQRKQEVDEIQLEVKNHNTQSITVLSIFSCVVFAFTGGFSLITGSLNVLSEISRSKALLLIGILMMLSLVLSDTIYMLIRAARHYSNDKQGHLWPFVVINVIVGMLAAFIMLLYYIPNWLPFLCR